MTKKLPHSPEAEMMVLGTMINNKKALIEASDILEESDFYNDSYRLLFKCLKGFGDKEKSTDIHLIAEELKRNLEFEIIGGFSGLMTLSDFASTSANIGEYCQIVKDKAKMRKGISIAQQLEYTLLQNPEDVYETLDNAQQDLFNINESFNNAGKLISEIIKEKKIVEGITQRHEDYKIYGFNENAITGLRTGFNDLDKILDGLHNSNLYILAARPAMGKTALALNICSALSQNRRAVGIFSLEMTGEQLTHRMICTESKIPSFKIKSGNLTDKEYKAVQEAAQKIHQLPLIVDATGNLKISEIRARARRMKSKYDISLLVIDYLTLISGSRAENKQVEVSEISKALKSLAKELNIPILCLSQLSRKVEERAGHRPMMSDLRDSGQIEADADVVMFLLRREYYDPNDKPGQAELIIGKNRHGEVGCIPLSFDKELVVFTDYIPLKPINFEKRVA